ncbi:hypothetical protein [Streptomyces sp. LN245]|uniref:hypothetical protein n=1 Tax=Streptomyces sp. LN245 TaxID=3112975 RepID=UPI003716F521
MVADLDGYADTGEIVRALSSRGRHFVVAAPAALPVLAAQVPPPGTHPGRSAALPAQTALTARQVLTRREAPAPLPVTLRTRRGEERTAHVLTGLVRLPEPGGSRSSRATGHPPVYRVFAERDPDTRRPGRTWITSLVNRPAGELLELAALHSGTADTVRRLEDDFGLLAFEGRSYPGWHHHMTLVSAAFAYSSLTTTRRGDN